MRQSSQKPCQSWILSISSVAVISRISVKRNRSGNRSMLRRTCSLRRLVSTPYRAVKSRSIITCIPLISIISRAISSWLEGCCSSAISNWSQIATGSLTLTSIFSFVISLLYCPFTYCFDLGLVLRCFSETQFTSFIFSIFVLLLHSDKEMVLIDMVTDKKPCCLREITLQTVTV